MVGDESLGGCRRVGKEVRPVLSEEDSLFRGEELRILQGRRRPRRRGKGDERLELVDGLEERLVRLELHRVDAHDELRQQLVLEEVDRLVRLERLVAVDDEEEVLEEDAEVWDDAFSPRSDEGAQRSPLLVDRAELPDSVETHPAAA